MWAVLATAALPHTLRTARGHAQLRLCAISRRRILCAAAAAAGSSAGDCRIRPALATSAPATAPDEDNIFGRILRGEAPADVIYDGPDDDLFVFRDRRPASTLHLLVIPKFFIRDASQLQRTDVELVRRMEAKARELVRAEVGAEAFQERELALGFHWPPWYSVPWLHLHAIYPKSQMRRRYKYTAVSFKSPEYVLRRLEPDAKGGWFGRWF